MPQIFPQLIAAVSGALCAVMVAITPIAAQAQQPTGNAPVMHQLTESVYSIFYGFYHGLIVIGDNGVLITDPANPDRAAVVRHEISKLTDLPVTHVVLTHEHFDHIGGTDIFEWADIYAQQNIHAVIRFDPLDIAPDKIDVTFNRMLEIDMGTTMVELHHFGAGDGVATTIVYLPYEGIVATADLYEDRRLTPASFLEDTNMLGVRHILNQLADWELNFAVAAHSPGTSPAALYENVEYFNDLYEAVIEPLEEAEKSDNPFATYDLLSSLPETVTLEDYRDWDGYAENLPGHVRRMALAIIHGG